MSKPAAASDTPAAGNGVAIAVWTLAVLAAAMFLRVAYDLMIPIVLGLLISFALNPLVEWLERVHVPRVSGAGLVLLVVALLLGAGIYSLRDEATEVLDGIPRAARKMREAMQTGGSDSLLAKLRRAATEVQKTADGSAMGSGDTAAGRERAPGARAGASGTSQTGSSGESGGGVLARGSAGLMTLAGHAVVIFFLVYFLLIGGPALRDRVIAVAGRQRRVTREILDEIHWQIQRFLLVRLITSGIVGVATWLALMMMDVRQALFWGIAAGVFNSIPYFGPIIVSGGLAVVGFIQFGEVTRALQLAGVALAITSLEGWLLTPPLMGRAARMNAITVFVGLLVWSWIWGIWGTILAVPMLATIKAVCDHIDGLQPIGQLMGE